MKNLLFSFLLLFFLAFQSFASQDRKVMIIGIDGTRSDALQVANTPNIDSLIANGIYTFDAYHLGITVSGPSWSDILCGVWEAKHGVRGNDYAGSNYTAWPYFPTRAKEVKPSLYCVQVTEWAPMSDQVYNDGWNQKIKVPDGVGFPTVAAAQTQLANPNLDAIFVYFDKVDLTGHSSGFSPSNPSYIAAIEAVDTWVGQVIAAVKSRPNYANENWLILLITDHGGIGTGHGGNTDQERHIWWIGSGNAIGKGQITTASDPGSYQMAGGVDTAKLRVTPVQTDIGVTALHHLIYDTGIRPENKSEWGLDGKSWLDDFTGIKNDDPRSLDIKVFPNPTTGLVTLWLETEGKKLNYEVMNANGQTVMKEENLSIANKLNIDLSAQGKGTYFIRLTVGDKQATKRVVLN